MFSSRTWAEIPDRGQLALRKLGFSHGVELGDRDEFIGHAGEKS